MNTLIQVPSHTKDFALGHWEELPEKNVVLDFRFKYVLFSACNWFSDLVLGVGVSVGDMIRPYE